ncbi:AzlD domain-containing protein [Fervidibacillus albus]|uniref:AzlD domain-containing protein n=1 Tax=Fervidibacillus albus TaxID=2980026 RepID=A0A9E8RUU4_9BACI|nr:AzlD domain-containing protein [Fervidibacillus albus]WAA08701.1 AzlD domain-containing protein [Fervidibacillus albus]
MGNSLFWLIIGMGLATFLPRMLPLVAFQNFQFPPFLQGVLKNVPYAILGALIFPGVLFIQEELWFGIVGSAIAVILASLGINVVIVVIGSIAVLTVVSLFVSM